VNERIKQIADDCGLYIAYDNREVTNKELSFFAETIVRECMDVVSKATASPNGYQALMKHFGVDNVGT
jgi:hypothetical protein